MRWGRTLALVATVAFASQAMAVTVQWSDFEVGTNYGLGPVGENMRAPAGYGPPTSYNLVSDPKTTGNTAQAYNVPGSAFNTNPDGEGWMIPDDGGGAFNATDWDDFIVNTLGGPAPAPNSPVSFIADVRIDADNLGDYDALRWFPIHNAPNSTFAAWDVKGGDPAGAWGTDFVFLTSEFDGAGQLSFILILASKFLINNPFAGDAHFYLDNVRIEYVPEPGTLALLGLGFLPLVRRRRRR